MTEQRQPRQDANGRPHFAYYTAEGPAAFAWSGVYGEPCEVSFEGTGGPVHETFTINPTDLAMTSDGLALQRQPGAMVPAPGTMAGAFGELCDAWLEVYTDLADDPATEPAECGAEYVTRGPDPSATSCDLRPGHYPASDHSGPDPFGDGGHVTWRGGGSCAGDRLPVTNVVWHAEVTVSK